LQTAGAQPAGREAAGECRDRGQPPDTGTALTRSGRRETVEQALGMLGHAGTLVYIGLPQPGSSVELPLERLFDRRLRIVVSHGGDHVPHEDFPLLAELAREGKIDLAGMVTRTISLDDVEQAFADMQAGEVIRSVIVINSS
jgi:S-(hydroxymethyl)mycothiol dehydrogenase